GRWRVDLPSLLVYRTLKLFISLLQKLSILCIKHENYKSPPTSIMSQSITKARSLLVIVALVTSAAALLLTLRNAMTSPGGLGFWNRTNSDDELAFPVIAEREIEAVPTTVAVVGDAADITFDAGGKGLVLDGNGAI